MPISGHLTGRGAIKAALLAMPAAVREHHGEAIRVTLWEMRRHAKEIVRVGTGTLQNHIDFSFSPMYARGKFGITPGTVVIRAGQSTSFRRVSSTAASVFRGQGYKVYRASHYAHLVEFGWRGHPGHPFMTPAFEGQQGPLDSRMHAAARNVADDLTHVGARYL